MARRLRGAAEVTLTAPVDACFAVVRDVESWPEWQRYVNHVDVVERAPDGAAARVALKLHVLAFHPSMQAAVTLDPPTTFALDRVSDDPDDDELLRLKITLAPDGDAATAAAAEVDGAVDIPRLLPLPRAIADHVATDILTALATRVAR